MTENTTPATGGLDAAQLLTAATNSAMIDGLLKEAKSQGIAIDGPDGLLNRMTKAILERALETEMTDHLGYESGDPAGRGTGNSRNGKSTKTVGTRVGEIDLTVSRDRNSTFEPQIVPKHARRIGNISDMLLSLYSHGTSTLRTIYTAPTPDAAELAMAAFETQWSDSCPGAVDVWKLAWDEFIPFLDYPAELAESSTPPMRSSRSTSNSGKSPRPAVISPTRTPQ